MVIKSAELLNKISELPIHDAKLVGVFTLAREEAVLLIIKSNNEQSFGIRLEQVSHLRTDDFLQGNIILDIEIYAGAMIEEYQDYVAYLFDASVENNGVSAAIEKIKKEELFLVQLNPSYGCSLHCLCKNLTVIADWQTELRKNDNF